MPLTVGVCAVQGDFEKHLEALSRTPIPDLVTLEVRTPADLDQVDRLILPGGESTTVGLLMERYGLGEAIQSRVTQGMPIWGTCMGMILLAKSIVDRPNQWTLGLLDATIQRNAFGAQVHSFETHLEMALFEEPIEAVFIRAPVVVEHGPAVTPLSTFEGKIVAVQQGHILGTSFHPELTEDSRLHAWFCRS